jgi:hypothetical protein
LFQDYNSEYSKDIFYPFDVDPVGIWRRHLCA